jgi:hypothetical protein
MATDISKQAFFLPDIVLFGQSTIIERLWEGETRNGGFNYTDQPRRKQIQVHHNEI